jgi:hypothetical protein
MVTTTALVAVSMTETVPETVLEPSLVT